MQHDYLEDAQKGKPVDADRALTDDQLEAGGLARVKAWVRTKQSSNAVRAKRHKEKLASSGVRQLNLQAAEDAHEALRAIAKASREGRDWRSGVVPDEVAPVVRTLERGGWRARLIRWLAGR